MNKAEAHYLSGVEPPTTSFNDILSQLFLADFQVGADIAANFKAAYNGQSVRALADDEFLSLTSDTLHLILLCQHNAAVLQRDLVNSVGGFPLPADPDFKIRSKSLIDAYYEALIDTAGTLNVAHLVHQPPTDRAGIKDTLKNWNRLPKEATDVDLRARMNDKFSIIPCALMSPQCAGIYALSSSRTICLWIRVSCVMSCAQSLMAKQACRLLFAKDSGVCAAREENLAFDPAPGADYGEANPRRHLNRMLQLAAIAVSHLIASESALRELSEIEPPFIRKPPSAVHSITPDLGESCSLHVINAMAPMLCNVATLPGTVKASLLPARDCAKFLSDQYKFDRSTYRMPEMNASQRVWNLWFSQISSLASMYEIEPISTIQILLSRISQDDDRVSSWYSTCSTKPVEYQTLTTFVNHIRNAVVVRSTTRMDARDSLLALNRTYKDIPTCRALQVRISQLFEQLFPLEPTAELEPLTYSQAVQIVHSLLADLKRAHPIKGELLAAWRAETQFNKSVLFNEYLLETRHRGLSNAALRNLLDEYLEVVYQLLEQAHTEHAQAKALPTSTPPEMNKNQVLALAASVLKVSQKSLSDLSGTKAKQGAGAKAKGNGKKRPLVAAVGGKSGKQPKNSKSSGDPVPLVKVCDLINSKFPHAAPGTLRNRLPKLGTEGDSLSDSNSLASMPYQQARSLIVNGACPICLEKGYQVAAYQQDKAKKNSSEHHAFKDCLHARGISSTDKQEGYMNSTINVWLKAWRECRPLAMAHK